MDERRLLPRRRVLRAAKIVFNDQRSIIDCTVKNLNRDGALLVVPSTEGIPPAFDLVFENGEATLACEIVWRRRDRLGVRCMSGGGSSG
jgi:hypothetical protein